MPLLAAFGITNSGLNLFVNLLILFLVVVWLALIAWTYLDARRRISDPVLVACATAASLFPFVGTIIYTILRPPEFIEDARERDLDIRASELRLKQLEEQACPNCEYPLERNYLRCPSCRARVKDPCESCGKPVDPRWSICPYCEMPVRRAAPPRREEGRRRPSRSAERTEKPQKPERSERSERQTRAAPRSERSARSERPERQARSTRTSSKSDGGDAERPERPRKKPSGEDRPSRTPAS